MRLSLLGQQTTRPTQRQKSTQGNPATPADFPRLSHDLGHPTLNSLPLRLRRHLAMKMSVEIHLIVITYDIASQPISTGKLLPWPNYPTASPQRSFATACCPTNLAPTCSTPPSPPSPHLRPRPPPPGATPASPGSPRRSPR